MLKKEEIKTIKGRTLGQSEIGQVINLGDGSIIKVFSDFFLMTDSLLHLQTERKILESDAIKVPEIVTPISALYRNGLFCGYRMEEVKGPNYTEIYDRLPEDDLYTFAIMVRDLENIIKKANPQGLVFPDILTCENIIKTQNGIRLIDFDGMQYKDMHITACSTSLGDVSYLEGTKYFKPNKFLTFTPEVDKLSMMVLYLLSACHLNLMPTMANLSTKMSRENAIIYIIHALGLERDPIAYKLFNLFNDKAPNEFISDDLMRIAEEYRLEQQGPMKKFKRK